jgi:tetratricopeptide (TPR) repeat protein
LVAESNIEAPAGNSNYALEVLEKAIKRKKNDPKLHVLVGDVYLKLHNGTEAYKAYTAALDKDSHFAEADYKLGTIFQGQKNVDVYLEHFNKAVANDKTYGPAYYELYRHYLYTDPAKAMDYFRQYAALSDKTLQQQYALADVLYLNKEYPKAIEQAKMLIAKEKDKVQGRLYKLIGYSYGEMKDTANAIAYMQQYFQPEMQDSAIAYYQRAIDAMEKPTDQNPYYKKLAALYKANKNYAGEAASLGKYYMSNDKATNVDLFNWGLAAYRAEDYHQADSVFGKYTEKYPEQGFGYYWRARSNAAIDTSLKEGLAVPHYTKLIEVLQADSLTEGNRKWMVQAYSYLAAYETNTQSDYKEAITYFDKILEIDPENSDAKKYITVLEQNLKREEAENTSANSK